MVVRNMNTMRNSCPDEFPHYDSWAPMFHSGVRLSHLRYLVVKVDISVRCGLAQFQICLKIIYSVPTLFALKTKYANDICIVAVVMPLYYLNRLTGSTEDKLVSMQTVSLSSLHSTGQVKVKLKAVMKGVERL